MASTADKTPKLKAVVLGNSGVGKASLIVRWKTGKKCQKPNPTVCIDHLRKPVNLNGRVIDLYVWDTAGQEQFQALTPLYCHSASCAIIVAAVDDDDSFAAIPNWVRMLEDSCDAPPPKVLFVNKIDRRSGASPTPEKVEDDYAAQFRDIFFISAETGEGVDAAFCAAADAALQFTAGTTIRAMHPSPSKCC
jgi:small GTP-binding protein